jgi:transcriptional regulator with XRE-family HTH domain
MVKIESLGQRITRLRKSKGMTQKELADVLGISRDMVASYEGDRVRIYDDMILKLAQTFSVSTDVLLGAHTLAHEATTPLNPNLIRRMKAIQALPAFKQKSLLLTIDTFLKGAGIDSVE